MRRIMDRDLLTALVLFAVGAVFSADGGKNLKDWVFPLLATYLVFGIAVALVVLAYVFVMHGIGFWLSSFLMVLLTSVYLTLEKTRRNMGLALAVPLAACVGAYLIFTHVFYVPFPEATWWRGLGLG